VINVEACEIPTTAVNTAVTDLELYPHVLALLDNGAPSTRSFRFSEDGEFKSTPVQRRIRELRTIAADLGITCRIKSEDLGPLTAPVTRLTVWTTIRQERPGNRGPRQKTK
jgi:hypothetical protein